MPVFHAIEVQVGGTWTRVALSDDPEVAAEQAAVMLSRMPSLGVRTRQVSLPDSPSTTPDATDSDGAGGPDARRPRRHGPPRTSTPSASQTGSTPGPSLSAPSEAQPGPAGPPQPAATARAQPPTPQKT